MIDHLPDVNWLIIWISLVNPDDEIFEPQYKYVRERNIVEPIFDNSDGFFSSMAMLTEKEIRKNNRIRLPKEMRFELRKERLKLKKQQIAEEEMKLIADIEESKKPKKLDPMLPQKRPRVIPSSPKKSPKRKHKKNSSKKGSSVKPSVKKADIEMDEEEVDEVEYNDQEEDEDFHEV